MQKIMFNDKYGLTKAVLEGRKTQTRRIADITYSSDVTCVEQRKNDDCSFSYFLRDGQYGTYKYKIGEEIAVAQPYKDVCGYYEQEYEIGKDLEEELKFIKAITTKCLLQQLSCPIASALPIFALSVCRTLATATAWQKAYSNIPMCIAICGDSPLSDAKL